MEECAPRKMNEATLPVTPFKTLVNASDLEKSLLSDEPHLPRLRWSRCVMHRLAVARSRQLCRNTSTITTSRSKQ
jgi:hypothetical protein